MKAQVAALLCALMLTSMATAEAPLQLLTFKAPPLVEIDNEDSYPEGITINLIERLFNLAKLDYELIKYPPQRALHMATSKTNTCVFPVERSQEREPRLAWLGPVAISRHALYSHPNRPIPLTTLEDARPYRISSSIGSGVGDYLNSLGFDVELTRDTATALLMTEYERTHLWAADILAAPIIADQLDQRLGNRELVIYTTQRYMGCNLDTDPLLLEKLRDALTIMHDRDEVRDVLKLENL